MTAFDADGFQIHIHAIGDGGVRMALDAIEAASVRNGPRDRRPVIAHTQVVQGVDRSRFASLGVIANFEPLWACLDPTMEELTLPRLGPARSALQYPIATIARAGAHISFGSDWPVSSMHPLHGLAVAVTRQNRDGKPDGGWLPEERLPITQALAAYTAGTAYQGFEDDMGGVIAEGRRADLCALSDDIERDGRARDRGRRRDGHVDRRAGGARVVSGERGSVELTDVTKRFGSMVAVDSLDLDVKAGEFLSLLGPSGCGKTTTLRMLAGFEQPDEGYIRISGQYVQGIPPHKRDVNTVFQHYALFPHMTVAENVAYGLRQKGVDKSETSTTGGRGARHGEDDAARRRKPRQLSGGQQQRVALARALVNKPSVLLLDEPLGALDRKLRQEMQIELKLLQTQVGITFIFVTHDQEEALSMSDRIVVMLDGHVEQRPIPTRSTTSRRRRSSPASSASRTSSPAP